MSSIDPLPVTVKLQIGRFDIVPDPVIVSATFAPLSCPSAFADTTRPLPQLAVNVPRMAFDVWEAIWYWKLPHEVGLGSVGVTSWEVHTPTSDVVLEPLVPVPGVGVGAGVFDAVPVPLGAVMLVAC